MPSTNQMILDLMANGFKLPEGLVCEVADGISWFLQNNSGRRIWHLESGQEKFAYDSIACEFARTIKAQPERDRIMFRFYWEEWQMAMRTGDSEAAIRALWEAVRGGTNES